MVGNDVVGRGTTNNAANQTLGLHRHHVGEGQSLPGTSIRPAETSAASLAAEAISVVLAIHPTPARVRHYKLRTSRKAVGCTRWPSTRRRKRPCSTGNHRKRVPRNGTPAAACLKLRRRQRGRLPIEADGRLGRPVISTRIASIRNVTYARDYGSGQPLRLRSRLGLDKDDLPPGCQRATMTPNTGLGQRRRRGPRHLAFVTAASYVISEMGSTLTVFRYDAGRGSLDLVETVPTLPADFKARAGRPRWWCTRRQGVYGSNRSDSIDYAVDTATVDCVCSALSRRGKNPRFNIDRGLVWLPTRTATTSWCCALTRPRAASRPRGIRSRLPCRCVWSSANQASKIGEPGGLAAINASAWPRERRNHEWSP